MPRTAASRVPRAETLFRETVPEIVNAQRLTLPSRKLFVAALHNGVGPMAVRIKLPGGTLKMKVYRELRDRERERRVPVLKMGSLYFVWWSNRQRPSKDERLG